MLLVDSETKVEILVKDLSRIAENRFITVDTEFIREKSEALLCLIQLATDNNVYIIDPIAVELSFLRSAFADQRLRKVFHAARQDLEILKNHGLEVNNFYDTQLHEMLLDTTENISYQSIVENYLKKKLKKSYSLSDWSHRPLSKRQLSYSAEDVTYLREIYKRQIKALTAVGRLDWIEDEAFSNEDSVAESLREDQYILFQKLVSWRSDKSQELQIFLEELISDKLIKSVCRKGLKFINKLKNARNISEDIQLEFLNYAETLVKDVYEDSRKKNTEVMLLQTLLNIKSEEHKVSPYLIATSSELNRFINGDESVKFLRGWRYEIFGIFVHKIFAGNLKLGMNEGRVVVYE